MDEWEMYSLRAGSGGGFGVDFRKRVGGFNTDAGVQVVEGYYNFRQSRGGVMLKFGQGPDGGNPDAGAGIVEERNDCRHADFRLAVDFAQSLGGKGYLKIHWRTV